MQISWLALRENLINLFRWILESVGRLDLGERWKALETQNRVEQMALFQYLTL
jgi:hypothetical protein